MAQLMWNKVGDRFFEVGVDQGVLFIDDGTGVAWNGLIAVKESPSGGEPTPYYIDGVKYLNVASRKEFAGTIEAFTYPEEFSVYDGWSNLGNGLTVDEQRSESFGLSYRTFIGNDVEGHTLGYKIHLVYNVLASPTDSDYQSLGKNTEAMTFSWSFTTRAERNTITTNLSTLSHLVVDSTKTNATQLKFIEDYIYGTTNQMPSMPSIDQMLTWFINPLITMWIQPDASGGLGILHESDSREGDLIGRQNDGIFMVTLDSGLMPTPTDGLYKLSPRVQILDPIDPTAPTGGAEDMVNYLIYPAIDEDYNFPHEIRQAIADSPEVSAAIEEAIIVDNATEDFDGGTP